MPDVTVILLIVDLVSHIIYFANISVFPYYYVCWRMYGGREIRKRKKKRKLWEIIFIIINIKRFRFLGNLTRTKSAALIKRSFFPAIWLAVENLLRNRFERWAPFWLRFESSIFWACKVQRFLRESKPALGYIYVKWNYIFQCRAFKLPEMNSNGLSDRSETHFG